MDKLELIREKLDQIRKSGFKSYKGKEPHFIAVEALSLLAEYQKESALYREFTEAVAMGLLNEDRARAMANEICNRATPPQEES